MFPSQLLQRVLLCSAVCTTLLVFWLLSTRQDPLLRLQTGDVVTQKDRSYFPATPRLCHNESTAAELCSSFPHDALANVQVIIKTGIGERHRLEAFLSSYGSCISNLLIVSDTPDIVQGHQVHDILDKQVAGTADSVEDAIARVEAGGIDAAILDVNLRGGEKSTPVAELLAERGVPFVFATGGSDDSVDERFRDRPRLQKPFTMDGVAKALGEL